ncbi:three-Cys-motif partner protein TcmP [Kibdelosporangium phytohabitans]|uniref:three-Cys-motif partner protein TcmP n=1 Tax=Kibdelosporangium phytohabitans TaxID=860235 RepID=UPI0009F921CA|nr:three-Cys-motif partner protein TcmP [Kibdelosporangium phytohabitans]MBE1466229.1 three-Cys-motif partner protein [Kibdelosporangium phytohabitans]
MTAHDDFFQKKQAAAVLKHGILTRYPPVFATMTGSTSTGGRVVYLDGYAGPGRYEPEPGEAIGSPGSPLLAVQNASNVAKWSRDLHCIFIERDAAYASNLRQVLSEEAPATLKYEVMHGDVEHCLDDALSLTGDSPLLAFLDPFGTALPYQQMVDKLMNRGDLKTEVLLNLNLEMVWRIGGFLSGEETDDERTTSGRSATLERVDNFLGGRWWRDSFRQARVSGSRGSAAAAARKVASEFCQVVETTTGFRSFAVPISRRPGHPPLFLMILFYRHPAAPYQFNCAVSGANGDWRSHFRQIDLAEELAKQQTQPDLFGSEFIVDVSEKDARTVEQRLETEWTDVVTANIRQLIAQQSTVSVQSQFDEIYGTTLGLAREKHVRRAWDRLADENVVQPRNTTKKLRKLTIVRAGYVVMP